MVTNLALIILFIVFKDKCDNFLAQMSMLHLAEVSLARPISLEELKAAALSIQTAKRPGSVVDHQNYP